MSRLSDHGGTIFAVARSLGVAPEQITDFSASINPLGISSAVRLAITGSLDRLVHYPDSNHDRLKHALAAYHRLAPENFTIGNGSTELIYHIPLLLTAGTALLISPSFSEYASSLALHGWQVGRLVLEAARGFAVDLEQLERRLVAGVDLLVLCNPGSPSGTLHPPEVIARIAELCRITGTFLLLDEAFMDFTEQASAKHLLAGYERTIILRSMTKFFGIPGLRLGYAISCPSLAEQLDLPGGPWRVNTLALEAGVAALEDVDHNRDTRVYVEHEREVLFGELSRIPWLRPYPSTTNYLLVEITGGMTARQLKELLLTQLILIRDCANFEGLSDHFFRVAVRTKEENQRLLGCLTSVQMMY